MGIIKVNARRKKGDHEPTHMEDSDVDFEIADMDCEIIEIRGQTCSMPYDLYGLDDLKEVLSLETWNLCLSEEERFSLTAYLPSVDQETFGLTMRELLNGESLFFGSPLDAFFEGLKGGLYSPRVSKFREALQFIHRCGYYHSLRSYHENMCQMFENMKKSWIDCPIGANVEDRLQIWVKRKEPKSICNVDLNVLPDDEDISLPPLTKERVNLGDRKAKEHAHLSHSKTKPKGVLKIRSKSRIPGQDDVSKTLTFDCFSTKPRGVLKIKPRSNQQTEYDQNVVPESDILGFQRAKDIGQCDYLHRKKRNKMKFHRERGGRVSPMKDPQKSEIYPQHSPLTLGLRLSSSFGAETGRSFSKDFGQTEHQVAENGEKVLPVTYIRKTDSLKCLKSSKEGDTNLMEEMKPVKVKLKIWTSQDVCRSPGLKNSL